MLKRYLNKEEVKSSEELFKVIAQVSTWYPQNKRIEIILNLNDVLLNNLQKFLDAGFHKYGYIEKNGQVNTLGRFFIKFEHIKSTRDIILISSNDGLNSLSVLELEPETTENGYLKLPSKFQLGETVDFEDYSWLIKAVKIDVFNQCSYTLHRLDISGEEIDKENIKEELIKLSK